MATTELARGNAPEHHVRGPEDPHRRPPGHERQIDRDIDVRRVAWTVAGVAVLTLLSMAAMWLLLRVFLHRAQERAAEVPAVRVHAVGERPPGPQLQASPPVDLAAMRAEEERLLSSYGAGIDGGVRIPIERAMAILAERGEAAEATAESALETAAGAPPADSARTGGGTSSGASGAAPSPAAEDETPAPTP